VLAIYTPAERCFTRAPAGDAVPADAVWIDFLDPTREEELAVERALGVDLPTREEMEEIEFTSRLYVEHGGVYMTALALSRTDTDEPHIGPITFVLAGAKLVTIRYSDPRAFPHVAARIQRPNSGLKAAPIVMAALIEGLVDRLADVLEAIGRDIEALSAEVFAPARRGRDYNAVLRRLGRKNDFLSKVRESLVSMTRLDHFAVEQVAFEDAGQGREFKNRMKSLDKDIASLLDHTGFLSGKIGFLLDATLGLINIEQNGIIKLFSVVSVALMPPTLIASIYGMNFEHMPELSWPWGYPMAVGLMIVSAALPLWYFRRRGWL
jgi:magnesium transporter